MSRNKLIGLGILGLGMFSIIAGGWIYVIDKLGLMSEVAPTLAIAENSIFQKTERSPDIPLTQTATLVAALPRTAEPSATPTATPTWISLLFPLIPNDPTRTPTPIANFSCIPQDTPRQVGVVSDVVDGDTIKVQLGEASYTVRYIGSDSLEPDTPFGELARVRNSELVLGKSAILIQDVSEKDRYDRLLRYVVVDGVFINQRLIQEGYAVAKDYPPDTACSAELSAAQMVAQSSFLGLWTRQSTEVPPLSSNDAGESAGVCRCTGNVYNCKDFSTQSQAQACYQFCKSLGLGDLHRLDSDHDGLVCESLP